MPALVNGQNINLGEGKHVLSIQKKLGSGAFGTVYQVRDIKTGRTSALKQILTKNQSSVQLVLREVKTLRAAKQERIVQLIAAEYQKLSYNDPYIFILTEFCAGGDLNSRLCRSSSEETNLKWITQLAEALRYLHSRTPPIVHRDLKADNVLLTDPDTENLKLGDFGLAREYIALKNVGSDDAAAIQAYYMTSGMGPVHWMAPEFFAGRYTEKADIFSLGGLFHAILGRDYITLGTKRMYGVFLTYSRQGKVGLGYAMSEIDQRAKVAFASSFQGTSSMRRLIEEMMEYSPNERPDAIDVEDRVIKMRTYTRLHATPASNGAQAGGWCC